VPSPKTKFPSPRRGLRTAPTTFPLLPTRRSRVVPRISGRSLVAEVGDRTRREVRSRRAWEAEFLLGDEGGDCDWIARVSASSR